MNQEQLKQMREGKGFIAALDQSGGSTPKALANYGVGPEAYKNDAEMFEEVHRMRTRIMTSPSFTDEHILAAILFENTMDREVEGKKTADYLWEEKHIVPFLKCDKGMVDEEDGVRLMKDMPEFDKFLDKAVANRIFGTKMRSVILSANREGIRKIVDQQFALAERICEHGLVPIIEPEVDIHIPDKAEAEEMLLEEFRRHLPKVTKPIMFKLTIPAKADLYRELMEHPQVVRVVALSGGYSREEANRLLAQNHGMIASFSRAFTEGLKADQTAEEFDTLMAASAKAIAEASAK
ncbi:MAG: fructose bisphosphate aldolase [Eubacteriales bacterium]|nr:fructose bisphosphate aldolase [Eubacteriales bacterium]